jgi:hypothetical protein
MQRSTQGPAQGKDDLRTVLNQEIASLKAMADEFPIQEKSVYAQWLAQTYYFVCHSTRLLALTSARFSHDKNDVHYRFAEHVREERGHEIMALRDLKAIGARIEDFPEFPETQAFYQTQYYWIEHVNPIAFFGYVLCLEAFAICGSKAFTQAYKSHGEKATSFLILHTKEDIGHVDQAFQQLNGLSAEEKELITKNLKLSAHLYRQIYERIMSMEMKSQKAA